MNDFATTLLRWYEENRRELPWRETRDPYAVWLSEVILQQTRIQQGWAYWERFMRRWKTVEELAAATEDEVLREWQGLGYYSRARNLHAAARQIAARGSFPDTYEEIRKLKGVGDYTAAAIASIAFGLPYAVVDGNVYRVLSRHFGIETPINSTEGKKEFAALAQSLLPQIRGARCEVRDERIGKTSIYNQAIMDFGAIQCTPQSPRCLLCPLQESCVALRTGRVEQLPVKLRKLKVKERRLAYIYIRCNGETAIRKRPPGDIWQGLWEPIEASPLPPPTGGGDQGSVGEGTADGREVPTLLQGYSKNGLPLQLEGAGGRLLRSSVRHVLTHRILIADFYLWETTERPPLPEGYIWIKEEDIGNYAVPRLVELLLEAVNGG